MFTAVRTMLLGLVVAAALVLGVASAGAGPNLVLNPGFETACGSVPCNWTALNNPGAETIARDTVNPHSGSASIAITSLGNFAPFVAGSDCISISPSTVYTESGWYRTTSSTPNQIMVVQLSQFSSASCTSVVALGFITAPPVTTGAWTLLSGQVTTASNAHSAIFTIGANCNVVCPVGQTANFDDVLVFTGPLAVTVVSFTAHRAGKGVLVRWRTGTEANELGFNVYRQQGARRVRVNRRLLPALGGIGGSSYSYRDRRAPKHRALRYWLQDVAVDGTRTWHGPVRVSGA
jgi:hypothetical protein